MDLPTSRQSRLRRVIIYLILADCILIAILLLFPGFLKASLDEEGYKLLWQIAIIAIGGGFISLLFAELKREQELKETRRRDISNFYRQVLSQYNKVKKCRRLLRAKAMYNKDNTWFLKINEYTPLMVDLEDCQLEFESFKKEIEILESLFGKPQDLIARMDSIEKYLGKILKKFEKGNYSAVESIAIKDFDMNIDEFIKHYEDKEKEKAPFFTQFSTPFDEIRKLLINDIQKQ